MTEASEEPDPERVRELAAYWEQRRDSGRRKLDEAAREFMAGFTPAEVAAALGLVFAEADAAAQTAMAVRRDPDGPEAQLSRIVHAGAPDEFDGLPDDAQRVFMLRIGAWASGECAAAAEERMAAWTSDDRAAFEQRFAARLPSGGHWPG